MLHLFARMQHGEFASTDRRGPMSDLGGKVALVTGGSRGVGMGTALGLAEAGATVYVTGRTVEEAQLSDGCIRIRCDHTPRA